MINLLNYILTGSVSVVSNKFHVSTCVSNNKDADDTYGIYYYVNESEVEFVKNRIDTREKATILCNYYNKLYEYKRDIKYVIEFIEFSAISII